jgi:UDP-2-acetamido-2,6-beta-L-arabino-hexul-4-ose reductase
MKKAKTLEKKADERGFLVEIFKEEFPKGQVYLFTSKPGVIRGNHWHNRKKEWFVCLLGKVKITLSDKKTAKKKEFVLDSQKGIKKLFIPAKVIHTVENIGQTEAYVLAFITEKFNPADPDTFYPK